MIGAENNDIAGLKRWSEALSWRAALQDGKEEDLTGAVGRQWQTWYANADNRRAFDAVVRLLGDRGAYRNRERPGKAKLDADRYDLSVPIAEWQRTNAPLSSSRQRSFTGKWWWILAGGMAAALAVIVAPIFLVPSRVQSGVGSGNPVLYETAIGHIKDVHLQDGSSIVLGGQTRLSVAFSGHCRSVRLIAGEAWFKVAHITQWPFVVTVGGSTITDVGTAFVVTLDSDRVFVTVTEGTVAVSARPRGPSRAERKLRGAVSPPTLAAVNVTSGEELSFGDNGAFGPARPTDTHAATAWVHGRLIFYNMPLRYVVEAVNRYSSRHIAVDPSAALLRFGGVVYDDEIEDWLKSLEAIFPVTVQHQGANVLIEMRQPSSRDALMH